MTSQARRGYEGYTASVGGDMPKWIDLPSKFQEAWRAAITAAMDNPKRSETPIDRQVRLLNESSARGIARKLIGLLPSGQLFILFTFDVRSNGNSTAYASNVVRDDAIRVMRDWLSQQGAL